MYTASKARTYLIFLPPHSSHITQPLNVGVFSPLKEYYHQQLASFVNFQATAPHQKQRFIRAYKEASKKAFSQSNVRAGFRAAGTIPTNVDRPLASIIKPAEHREVNELPTTPKKPRIDGNKDWRTPRDSKEVRDQAFAARTQLAGVDREVRTSRCLFLVAPTVPVQWSAACRTQAGLRGVFLPSKRPPAPTLRE
ncbi:hypothetical protein HIM_10119 [Hirsutella minnesotensis 3608]|uniref:DDE-1 domain-containing protein n=1 Tax=Hirsutella minnesotensis 3608 TaxID=1043627 RepID=A0A0F7ZKE6_9HYPO|nr:hypothetical protein HIM_10119 [Hirsutella minnesotensis 3608]